MYKKNQPTTSANPAPLLGTWQEAIEETIPYLVAQDELWGLLRKVQYDRDPEAFVRFLLEKDLIDLSRTIKYLERDGVGDNFLGNFSFSDEKWKTK
jgi:hypothetical protein